MENKELKKRESELAARYDRRCHYKKNGVKYGATIWLKELFPFGENIEEGDLEYFDDEEMKIRGFYTWQRAIILTDGCGDGDLDDMLSDEEARKFLGYISDENNLKFEV